MGPFRRTKSSLDAAEATASRRDKSGGYEVAAHEYRRLGDALATVVATITPAPPSAGARLLIAGEAAPAEVDAMLVTHQAPGTADEAHRLWFVTDLSRLMFGDAEFTLLLGDGAEIPLPQPAARAAFADDDAPASAAWSESELQAALTALEERCRSAERLAAALRATTPAIGADDALTQKLTERLTAAHREVEALQELLDTREAAYRAVKDVVDKTAADRDALRGDAQRMSKLVAVTLADVQSEREELLGRLRDAQRENQELRARMDAQGDELDRARTALRHQRERFDAPVRADAPG